MLHDDQQKFLDGLFKKDTGILKDISETGPFSPEQRFQVYQNNLLFILCDVLKSIFPVCARLVSDDFFLYTARNYIKIHPPTSGDMTFYGDQFPEFLADFAPLKEHPYIPDVAALEWAVYLSSQETQSENLDMAALSDLQEDKIPQLRFQFQPHVQLVHSTYSIDQLWHAVMNNQTEMLTDITLSSETYLILFRKDDQVTFTSISKDVYVFITALYQGETFGDATAQALEIDEDFAPEQHLSYFFSNQILTSAE